MLNIAICDDSKEDVKKISDRLSIYINNNNIKACVKEFHSGLALIEAVKEKPFDIIFLDIYMPPIDGIQTATEIRKTDAKCKIIFLSSSQSHAVLSYDVKANHYLLKPIENDKLYTALKVAIDGIEKSNSEYLVIKSNNEFNKLFFKNIIYIESKARILMVYTEHNNLIKVYKKLSDFEEELNDARFFRSHKSYLVNLDFVEDAKDRYFVMTTGENIPISSKFRNNKKMYIDYLVSKL